MAKKIIALAGQPNCGKSTVFNSLTGAKQFVANYPGVTVDKKEGYVSIDGVEVLMVDLPGTYSLTAYSQENFRRSRSCLRVIASLVTESFTITDASSNPKGFLRIRSSSTAN